jgi:hypothetical protein
MKNNISLESSDSAIFRFCILILLIGPFLFSQVGINTVAPKSTLEVVAKTNGALQVEGLMIPRLTGIKSKR